jgi:hypothetical protein
MVANANLSTWGRGLSMVGILLVVWAELAVAQPTMDALWPNEDGRTWLYAQVFHDWFGGEVIENEVRLFFDGTDIVPGGIVVQDLKVEATPAEFRPRLVGHDNPPAGADPFYRALWRSRPDLRDGIRAKLETLPPASERYPDGFYQVLIGEAAFRKSDEDIAAYRTDIEAMKAWIWLISDLTIGGTFSIQLVPDLADDVWLYGTVARWENVAVPAGTYTRCLRVEYLIDFGESVCTDENGNELGGFRSETRGFIDYAPEVGPVNHYEEWIPFVEFLWGDCPWQGFLGMVFTSGSLQLTAESPTPIQQTTWGRIKAAFRQNR